ncbi:hypothetical protein G3I35_13170, partial [Streptomyces sp. SID10815]|nr:hypothetical protein [Streptomyces sp. SID10815]
MTSSPPPAPRQRRTAPRWSARVTCAVLLVGPTLPVMTINTGTAVAATAAPRAGPQDETSDTALVLPLVALGAAGVLAGYGCLRRARRAR